MQIPITYYATMAFAEKIRSKVQFCVYLLVYHVEKGNIGSPHITYRKCIAVEKVMVAR